MARNRVNSLLREAEYRDGAQFPQLAPPPDDYPTFPDKSTWPVEFPELPPAPDGGPRRPPQHVFVAALEFQQIGEVGMSAGKLIDRYLTATQKSHALEV